MKFNRIVLFIVLSSYLLSCKAPQKIPTYLEKVNDTTGKGTVVVPELLIQKNDRISIQIISLSELPEKSDVPYNQPVVSNGGGSGSVEGYLVDINGNIHHHRLGTFHAEGKTKEELAAEIRKRLLEPVELLSDPTVVIRFLNFKVTVLGEVSSQGVLQVPGERLTILEAVGLAGGISEYGKKTNLRILREYNGVRETGTIDLTDSGLFESPYYNLKQNDVVIVDATNQKQKDADDVKTFRKVSFALSLVTVAATLANIFIRN